MGKKEIRAQSPHHADGDSQEESETSEMRGTSSEKRRLDSIREELREAGRMATAFQRRLALARFHVPDLDSRVPGCRHDGLAVGRKIAR